MLAIPKSSLTPRLQATPVALRGAHFPSVFRPARLSGTFCQPLRKLVLALTELVDFPIVVLAKRSGKAVRPACLASPEDVMRAKRSVAIQRF